MKEWYDNLDNRERRILFIGSAVLVVALLYLLAWEPLVKKIDSLEKSNAEKYLRKFERFISTLLCYQRTTRLIT